MDENLERCCICGHPIQGEDIVLTDKGANGVNTASIERGDNITVREGSKVHVDCRKTYTNKKNIQIYTSKKITKNGEETVQKRKTREHFDAKQDCIFCGTIVQTTVDKGAGDCSDRSQVKTESFTNTVLECCDQRLDDWSFTIKGRIIGNGRLLHATGCLYHHTCSTNFRTQRDIPREHDTVPAVKRRKSRGRPQESDQAQAFCRMCSYLETNDDDQLTLSD